MLYSTDYIADIEEIYESYVKGGGRELICMAYLSYFADAWLVRNMVSTGYVFEQILPVIRKKILSTMRVNSMLKYFSERAFIRCMSCVQRMVLSTRQKPRFAFFLEFEKKNYV